MDRDDPQFESIDMPKEEEFNPDEFDHSSSVTDDPAPHHATDEEMLMQMERHMKELERNAHYIEAESARRQLEIMKKKTQKRRLRELERIQAEDIKLFLQMISQHQEHFNNKWSHKTLEHKLKADESIEQLRWKHEEQQRELFEQLKRKRVTKFSAELLDMRKREVVLAKNKNYLEAEKVKRQADVLEQAELERVRALIAEENQMKFEALLKRQEWDRIQLSNRLKIEYKSLMELKAQDFHRLKKRLRNAEAELRKTHVRQTLQAERKLAALYSSLSFYNSLNNEGGGGGGSRASTSASDWPASASASASAYRSGSVPPGLPLSARRSGSGLGLGLGVTSTSLGASPAPLSPTGSVPSPTSASMLQARGMAGGPSGSQSARDSHSSQGLHAHTHAHTQGHAHTQSIRPRTQPAGPRAPSTSRTARAQFKLSARELATSGSGRAGSSAPSSPR